MAHPLVGPRGGRRLRVDAAVRVRAVLGDGGGRHVGPHPRGVQQRQLHGDLPALVHREHLRRSVVDATGPAGHRGVEPGVRVDAGGAEPVRKHRPADAAAAGVAPAEPDRGNAAVDRADADRVRAVRDPPLQEGCESLSSVGTECP
ncbi:hypothetical protein RHCRD62_20591 [Rhodococcus sp. RD6.2]|nr:hypothetical protein RHCRD62_20591 [Rhodococcus sp. RD6.2]